MVELRSDRRNDQLISLIGRIRFMPVIRVDTAHEALQRARALLASGRELVELTATTAGWPSALRELTDEAPDAVVGVGTVTTAADAQLALGVGARFVVSPYPAPAVAEVAGDAGALFIEGGFTPDQVARASERGIAKLFPAHLGGIEYLRSLLAVLPGARIVPSGGIAPDDVPAWLEAGAFAVGGSAVPA